MNDATWACSRCGQANERLQHAPWPGELGARVQSEICAVCWREWMGVQTKIINEYRLNVLDPEHAGALRKQMAVFFGFEAPPEQEG
jgi:Fe-S cluster biosynthesis and repair protein YggX